MKKIVLVISLSTCLVLFILFSTTSKTVLKAGVISFENLDAKKESFTIKTHAIIPPQTLILFTDTEWNGNHFGIDENTMTWYSGKDSIPKGKMIHFKYQKKNTIASLGYVNGSLKIAYKKDAIFAYQGTDRMPIHFIAGIAYNLSDYGTLQNTGLLIDHTAIVLSK